MPGSTRPAGRPGPVMLRQGLLGAFVLGLAVSITLSEAALAALVVEWLWRLRDPAARRRMPVPLLGPVLALAAVTVASALVSGHPGPSLAAARGSLLVLALYVVAAGIEDAAGAHRLLSALLAAGALAGLVGLVQVLACPSGPPAPGVAAWFFHRCDRARGFFSIYMTQAGVLSLVLLAGAPRLLPGASRRAPVAAAWAAMLAGLAATYVRGAWLGFGAGMLSLVLLVRRGRLLLVVALAAAVALALLGPSHVRQRLLSMTDPDEATIKERVYMWRSGAAMLREGPILGLGPAGVKREYARFALPEAVKQRTGHLHNTPLQILVERGCLGLAAWVWVWVAFYARVGRLLRRLGPGHPRERALAVGAMAAVTGFLVAGLSEYNFGDAEVVLVAWTVMALPFAALRAPAADREPSSRMGRPG